MTLYFAKPFALHKGCEYTVGHQCKLQEVPNQRQDCTPEKTNSRCLEAPPQKQERMRKR